MKKSSMPLILWLALSLLWLPACAQTATPVTSPVKVDSIRLVGTIGPLSIPLAYMVEKNSLASVAKTVQLTTWANPTQLQAIIAGGQGDFVSLPTNSAATFYNRGLALQLLDSSIWNILYLVTADTSIKSVTDLKGKRVVVPYQGAIPDAMFRYICLKQGINPDNVKDIDIFYASDPVQASQLLLTGQERYVLLSEPSATSVILRAQATSTPLVRTLNMKIEWERATGGVSSTPIAGTVVLGDMRNRPDIVKAFLAEYQKAIRWMLDNPVEAGQVGARALAEQGFTAEVLTESLKNIDWRFVSSVEGQSEIEGFFKALLEVSPNYTGGKLPDTAFYYGR